MSKGISLHIGVSQLSENRYRSAADLCSPGNDAKAMADIARYEGYEPIHVLVNETATKANVLNRFSECVAALHAGDTFLLTFSGHGGQKDDMNGDEEDGQDERWCLYDDYLLDDELGSRWKEFREGVRIIVVSSSCHSRTGIRPYHNSRPFGKGGTWVNRHRKAPVKREVVGAYPPDPEIMASIIHLSACEDWQLARDGSEFSVFTGLLLKYWDHGRFEGSHEELIQEIGKKAGYLQTPGIMTLGKNSEELVQARPFRLLTNKP